MMVNSNGFNEKDQVHSLETLIHDYPSFSKDLVSELRLRNLHKVA
jgi:hypothetical protein